MLVKFHARFRVGKVKHGTEGSGAKGPQGSVALPFTQ